MFICLKNTDGSEFWARTEAFDSIDDEWVAGLMKPDTDPARYRIVVFQLDLIYQWLARVEPTGSA